MAAFTTLIVTERDFGSPFNEDVADALHDRDKDLQERPFYLEMAETSHSSASYVIQKTWQIYIPRSAESMRIAFQMRVVGGGTASAQFRIPSAGLTYTTATETTGSYSDEPVFWCLSSVGALVGTEVTVNFKSKTTAGTVFTREANGPISYFSAG